MRNTSCAVALGFRADFRLLFLVVQVEIPSDNNASCCWHMREEVTESLHGLVVGVAKLEVGLYILRKRSS